MVSGYPSSFLHESLAGCARACYFVAEDLVEPPSDARPPGKATQQHGDRGNARLGANWAAPWQLLPAVSQNLANEDVVKSVCVTRERPGSISNSASVQMTTAALLLRSS